MFRVNGGQAISMAKKQERGLDFCLVLKLLGELEKCFKA